MITKSQSINEYIASLPADIQQILEQVRTIIKKAAPEAEETIKYAIPTFTLKVNSVHFGAFKIILGSIPYQAEMQLFKKNGLFTKAQKSSIKFRLI